MALAVLGLSGESVRADSTAVLADVPGWLSSPAWSADGSWRLVEERSGSATGVLIAVWRSDDGVNWERVTVPAAAQVGASQSRTQIEDDGDVMVVGSVSGGVTAFQYISGSWSSTPATLQASTSSTYYPVGLVSDGSNWVVVTWGGYVY